MAAAENESGKDDGVSRREFIGSATLTAAGIATGLSFYFSRPRAPDLADYDKEENQVRMGYIGVGNRGGSLCRSSLQAPGCVPVAVADIRDAQRKDFVDRMRTESRAKMPEWWTTEKYPKDYDDYRRLLDDKRVEAVTIATPHYLHAPMALEALEAGKHVYCEKAMAYTIGENQDIYNLVKARREQVFQVGHQRRYSPLYTAVKKMVDEGKIGEIAAMRAQWNQKDIIRRACPDPAMEKVINWRLYSEFSGGLSTEFASHQVDVANWMLGTHPDSVCGYGGVDWYQDGRDTSDNIHLIFNYKLPIAGKTDAEGKAAYRNVRFTYTSMMENSYLGPSELILGTKGAIEVCLSGGGEYFVEPSAEAELEAAKEADRAKAAGLPPPAPKKKAVKAGATVPASCLRRKKGELVDVSEDKRHWVKFTKPLEGGYDTGETFLALGAFLDTIRASRAGRDTSQLLRANVEVGLYGAVPCLMANIAMREQRTVYWSEFFPNGDKA